MLQNMLHQGHQLLHNMSDSLQAALISEILVKSFHVTHDREHLFLQQ